MAMAVLPVLRSPMISSRWPRPIGVMASIALMPVCSGSSTGWRPAMPGAWISIRRSCVPTSSPRPSIGSPSGLTTRPITPSPTGTERMRERRLDRLALVDRAGVAEDDDADRVLFEVEGEADGSVLELDHLVDGGIGQAVDAGDAVADLDHAADRARLEVAVERVEVLLDAAAMSAAESVSSAMGVSPTGGT